MRAFPLVLVCVALCAGCDEHRQYSYSTRAEAEAAGEITRGWLPDWLPSSARDIKLLYAVESPQTWGAFRFAPADMDRLRQHLTPLVDAKGPQQFRGAATSWWPEFLRGQVDAASLRQRGFDVYIEADPGPYRNLFVINEAKGAAYFYRR